jgi:uncharacterized membrane protein
MSDRTDREPSVSTEGVFDRFRDPVEFSRLLTLSDGVFAIALTLLVLSLEIPPELSSGAFGDALVDISPMLVAFLVSVVLIAIFWFSHHELFAEVARIDHPLMWMGVAYLGLVVLIPFVQRVQGNYPFEPIVYMMFAGLLALLNLVDLSMHWHVYRRRLLHVQWSEDRYRTEMKRGQILVAGFIISIPLALVLVNLTILIWVALLPLDRWVKQRGGTGQARDTWGPDR